MSIGSNFPVMTATGAMRRCWTRKDIGDAKVKGVITGREYKRFVRLWIWWTERTTGRAGQRHRALCNKNPEKYFKRIQRCHKVLVWYCSRERRDRLWDF